ncbi:SLIT2.2 family protein [Megaselia abdita]
MTKIRQNREESSADNKHNIDYEISATDMYAYADDDPMAGAHTLNDEYVTEEGMQADANADFFDDYDEDDKVMKDSNRQSRTKFDDEDDSYEDGSGGKFSNDDDDSDDDDDFFVNKRKSNRGRFNNDAIKIISTPLGKVGIVYEQPQTSSTSSHSKSTPTDFDSLSPASVSGRHSTHPKITPVLTADGKVALLYRGDSESTKYEPIKNFTNTFNLYDNKTNVDSKIKKYEDSEEDMGWDEDDEEIVSNTSSSESKKNAIDEQSTNNVDEEQGVTEIPELSKVDSGIDNSVLPMINKPLSEVLGIKKNQFTQFRIKDNEQMTTPPSVLPPFVFSSGGESKSINHENPSINLGGFYNSRAAADFDFGRDATMLDAKMHLSVTEEQNKGEGNQLTEEDATIAASDVLAKTEVVNLAIIPHFDEEFEKQQHLRDHELRRLHHRQRHRYRHINEDISNIHCIMQAMMGVAAVSTVFGMLGAMFKQKIIDAIRSLHW